MGKKIEGFLGKARSSIFQFHIGNLVANVSVDENPDSLSPSQITVSLPILE